MRRRSLHVTGKQRTEAARWRALLRVVWAGLQAALDARFAAIEAELRREWGQP